MTAFRPLPAASDAGAPGTAEQVTQLAAILALVEEMAGRPSEAAAPLSDERRVRDALARVPDIARYRFDMLIAEGAAMASHNVRPLLDRNANPAAAACLADELRHVLARAEAVIGL